jgi:curved DNA-binding protein
MENLDYYEFLQISPKAEPETIHRVYRFLAGRLHPDNPGTGDAEKFLLLKQAFDVLSDPERRAEYDATYKKEAPQPIPLSTSIDFMDNIDGELNRRLAVLALLYIQRRTNPFKPEVDFSPRVWKGGALAPPLQGHPDYFQVPHPAQLAAASCAGCGTN